MSVYEKAVNDALLELHIVPETRDLPEGVRYDLAERMVRLHVRWSRPDGNVMVRGARICDKCLSEWFGPIHTAHGPIRSCGCPMTESLSHAGNRTITSL